MNQSSTRKLTEGAILIAFFAVLLLISTYVPLLSIVSTLFLALPFIVYSARYSLRESFLMLAAALGVSAIISTLLSLPLALMYGTVGIVMGWMIQKGKSKFNIFIASTLVLIANILLMFVVSLVLLEQNIVEQFFTLMNESMENSFALAASFGQDVTQIRTDWTSAVVLFESLLPTLIVFSAASVILFIMIINFPIVRRLKIDVPKFQPFREIVLPKSVIWYYLIVLIITLVSEPEAGSMFSLAIANLQIALELLMIVQGLSFIHFYSHLKKWNKGIIILLTIFGLLLSPFTRILGIIDLGFDLRHRLLKNS
ncbi:YybS family protein [Jeotgalibacillus soli]|uniref:DUF2232 domain-containing protein n=1 Tax=Jeotgalibacillus soli TaxID=889306 RepID=A0A0C2RG87_9BACL|nr:YybS family protein [Jeotgalibacillus soli]KIL49215.1 hypothetical protein KP78_06830 [Jeotgalibacillus soli]